MLTLRSEAPEVTVAGRDHDVVEVWADAGRASRYIPVDSSFDVDQGGRLSDVGKSPGGQAELLCVLCEPRLERGKRFPAEPHEFRPQHRDLLAPRGKGITARQTELDAAESRVPLREGSQVILWGGQTGRKQPSGGSVEVRSASCRATFYNRQPVRCEDESGKLAPKELCGGQPGAVELRLLGGASGEPHRHRVMDGRAHHVERQQSFLLTEAHELPLGPRAWREPLGADMKRLEQVGLPGPVLTHHQDDSG